MSPPRSSAGVATGRRPLGIRHPECIVVWNGDRLEVCGKPITAPDGDPLRLVCRTWVEYDRVDAIPDDAQQWLEIDPHQRTVRVRTSDFGERPLFCYLQDSLCVVAPAILPLAEALVARGRTVDWDRVGILESLLHDHPFRHRTYFDGIERMVMGEEVTLSVRTGEIEREKTWKIRFAASDEPRRSLDDAVEVLRDLTTETPLPEGAVHPLSGGYDSRLLLCLAVAEGRRPRTVTFGEFGSADLTMARRVAEHLGVPNESYAQRPEALWTHGIDASVITGGMVTPAHRHIYSMFRDLEIDGPLVHGYLGGELTGEWATRYRLDRGIDEGQAYSEVLASIKSEPRPVLGAARRVLWEDIAGALRSEIEQDLRLALDECLRVNPPSAFAEYLRHVDGLSGMEAHVISMFEVFGPCVRPYASRSVAEVFNAAPEEARRNRRLFLRAALTLFPEAFSLPSLNRPWGPSVPHSVQAALKMMRNALQLGTDLLSGGHLVAFSPYWSEQQDYLIRRHYRPALDEATDVVERLLDTELTTLRCTSIPKWHNAYRQLRLLGLRGLMQHSTYRALTDQGADSQRPSSASG